MLLAIDVGNSNINVGVSKDGELVYTARIATDPARTEDQYAIDLSAILGLHKTNASDLGGVIISSVVPSLAPIFKRAVTTLKDGINTLLLEPGVKTGLNIRIDNPAQLGSDLVACAVAANLKFPKPCVIFDLGTATKAIVLDQNGTFIGCSIMPGLQISLEALSDHAAQLPHISLEDEFKLIGTNTVDSMKSGALIGTASMIDGMSDRFENELGQRATIIVTGGLSKVVLPYLKRDVVNYPTLVLDGLRLIYEKNLNLGKNIK